MTIVYLMRHGEALKGPGQSEDDLFSVADLGLSPRGVEQANAAAATLAKQLGKETLDAVFASPALRAIETARIVGAQRIGGSVGASPDGIGGREPTIEKRFAEWPIPGADYEAKLAAIMDLPRQARQGPLFPRERLAFSEAMKEIASHYARTLVVSHGLANRGFLCKARNVPLPEILTIEQEHASLTKLEWKAGSWKAEHVG